MAGDKDKKQSVLDLDELFGQDRPVVVMWDEKRYEFMRMAAIGPREALKFDGMLEKSAELRSATNPTDKQLDEINDMLGKMISVLSKDFPIKEIGFMHRLKVIEFYMVETSPKN